MKYTTKKINDIHLSDILNPAVFKDFFILSTYIDSDPNTGKILQYHVGKEELEKHCTLLGNSAIFKYDVFSKIVERFNLLNGFDEIWCFREMPTTPIPSNVTLCGVENIDSSIIYPWMIKTNCIAGFGDGLCLNCIATEPAIIDLINKLVS